MPWKEQGPMDQRVKFIGRLLEGEKMVDLCREFGISRKTGYKFLERYEKYGVEGLSDASRRPFHLARKTDTKIEELLIKLKAVYPTWGPKKLREKLVILHPGIAFPVVSTMGEILLRHGLVQSKKRQRIENSMRLVDLSVSKDCNEVWNTDFKGQFRLTNREYCYPLTVTDDFSRFLISCESLNGTKVRPAIAVFEQLFDEFGLPEVIKSDNGVPFSARGIGGLSELSAWWMRLGIRPERIKPGNPQENARHERMHRTLKAEATRPAGNNFLHQQEKFDDFREQYNHDRPHEALDMKCPGDLYQKSPRLLSAAQSYNFYELFDYSRRVNLSGNLRLPRNRICFIGRALRGIDVGVREIGGDVMTVSLGPFHLGYVDARHRRTTFRADNPLMVTSDE